MWDSANWSRLPAALRGRCSARLWRKRNGGQTPGVRRPERFSGGKTSPQGQLSCPEEVKSGGSPKNHGFLGSRLPAALRGRCSARLWRKRNGGQTPGVRRPERFSGGKTSPQGQLSCPEEVKSGGVPEKSRIFWGKITGCSTWSLFGAFVEE